MPELTVDDFIVKISNKLKMDSEKDLQDADSRDIYYAIAAIVNEDIMPQWEATKEKYEKKMNKQVYYLSMEFLIGSLLESNLLNCGLRMFLIRR